jgi:hypothetical protein
MLKRTLRVRTGLVAALMFVCACSFAETGKSGFTDDKNRPSLFANSSNTPVIKRLSDSIYNLVGLGNYGVTKEVFFKAYKGYRYLLNQSALSKKNLLTICDYSQSSRKKRLYVIDLSSSRLLFNTYVSHGTNSGGEYATSFSNLPSSNKSSLGFMVTAETYSGIAGYSMRLNGMEAGINDLVRSRDIVLHGSQFVNEAVISARGRIGSSYGCPAVPFGIHEKIIDAIKGGSCFYIYNPDTWYTHTSTIINSKFDVDLSPVAAEKTAQPAITEPSQNTTVTSPVTAG